MLAGNGKPTVKPTTKGRYIQTNPLPGAVRRHRVDCDDKVCCRDRRREVVEGDLRAQSIDHAGVFRGQLPTGCTALQINPVDIGYRQQPRDVGRPQRALGHRRARRIRVKDQADLGQPGAPQRHARARLQPGGARA
jgi:hypothetical protein